MPLMAVLYDSVPARPVAMARILVSMAALLKAGIIWFDMRALLAPGMFRMPYGISPDISVAQLPLLIGAWMACALAALVGWHTRLALAGLCASVAVTLSVDQQLFSNHLYLLELLTFLLCLADSGAALSLDARRRGTQETVAAWPVLLIKVQLTIVYLFAVLSKSNPTFGLVLMTQLGMTGFNGEVPLSILLLAYFTFMVELTLALALWLSNTRPFGFLLGFGTHVAFVILVKPPLPLTVFGLLMLSMYFLFLEARPRTYLVVWDDQCSFCRAWVTWFKRLDWLEVCVFAGSSDREAYAHTGITPDETEAAIQVVHGKQRWSGYEGIRQIAAILPLTCFVAPFFAVPPVSTAGERAYANVAQRRRCLFEPNKPQSKAA